MTITYNKTGSERKRLVAAISQELNAESKYLGMPSVAYEVGDYRIDKNGTVTGPDDRELTSNLCGVHGFTAVSEEYDAAATETPPAFEDLPETDADEPENETGTDSVPVTTEDGPGSGQLAIVIPLDGFTPEALDNLCKLVQSKESLLKKAFCREVLPIQVLEDRISFPWFAAEIDEAHFKAYTQFIACLAETAKKKKRVTARPQESFENEKFTMRVWLIGLGMVGKEYGQARKLLMAYLLGNSSWRYGPPEKAAPAEETAPASEAAPAGETAPAPNGAEADALAEAMTEEEALAEALADAELIHAVNESFLRGGAER